MKLQAIETRYSGYRFRSRLEARWAVFFDCLGLPWEYEPEGFVLPNGKWYLPDFRVRYPGQGRRFEGTDGPHDVWFEVKPSIDSISPDEWAKVEAFDSEHSLTILDGVPAERLYLTAREAKAHGRTGEFDDGLALWSSKGRLWWDDWRNFYVYDGTGARDDVVQAVIAARSARFDRRAA